MRTVHLHFVYFLFSSTATDGAQMRYKDTAQSLFVFLRRLVETSGPRGDVCKWPTAAPLPAPGFGSSLLPLCVT